MKYLLFDLDETLLDFHKAEAWALAAGPQLRWDHAR